ncbi:restriction endonuclease subunit S [Gloeothece verrucosa]|uniref:Restriction modification system DNA specificity domain protein n=1 Tax=Gloeothece verrucosa (strain PCC 7822) TaxID=497965 RepID=E0UAI4_GLOV7|nr:restriction endonuclease subunit S [Gloeothece verrucosa]ADN12725.1 restriction modification system DNA specificity domain protein [Gloeothece verrucosa PCC 7822]
MNFKSTKWQVVTLEDIAQKDGHGFVDGPFGSNLPASEYVPFGIPVIRGTNLSLGTTRFKDDEFVFVSEETAKRLERSLCEPGDIIFTKKGTLGQTAIIPFNHKYQKFLLSSNQMKLTVDIQKAEPLFVYYYVSSFTSRSKIIQDSEATGVPKTNLTYLRKFPIVLPPLPEQKAIAHILGTLDDKIELNQQMNQTLEAMARAIFKSWFVDFDPVRAKMEGKQLVGMDEATAALFPDSFEESDLGLIPKGWRVSTLDEVTEFVLGGDWGKDLASEQYNQPAYCIRGADIPDLQNAGLGKMPIRYLKASSLKKRSLQAGNIVIEISGGSPTQSTGRPVLITLNLLDRLSYPLVCSNFCRLIFLKEDISPNFIYLWLRWLYASDSFLQYENGTTGIKNLAYKIFSEKYELVLPQQYVLKVFEKTTQPLFKKRDANGLQSEILATIRDTLLPKLMSGQIRVKEAEKMIEEVL